MWGIILVGGINLGCVLVVISVGDKNQGCVWIVISVVGGNQGCVWIVISVVGSNQACVGGHLSNRQESDVCGWSFRWLAGIRAVCG